jgi:hypothetical protein
MGYWMTGYGALLTLLGVGGFVATGARHKTALIPAGFGVTALGLAQFDRRGGSRRKALQGSALVGLLGFLGAFRGLARLPALLRGKEVERPAAVVSQSLMAGLSAAHVALCLRTLLRAPGR